MVDFRWMKGWFFSLIILAASLCAEVKLGVDCFFERGEEKKWIGKKIGMVVNHTSVDGLLHSTLSRFQEEKLEVVALFTPEHGLHGQHYANDKVASSTFAQLHGQHYANDKVASSTFAQLKVHSLHGVTKRPTAAMLQGIDLIVYDIQCTGVRAYTYPTTLFYIMEEAAKQGIEVLVLDRPNPINGLTVDGPMLDEKWRSFIGYINVPYCHGMTIGELAQFFNEEYQIGCKLHVVPMQGWKRSMSYRDTELHWIPPSPNVPEPDTPLFCPITGLLGELHLANIGIGYTLPFKIVGAPWMRAETLAQKLNDQKLPGVHFHPFHFRPFWGIYKGIDCQGVLIQIDNPTTYRPLAVQYLILGLIKTLYPKEFVKCLTSSNKNLFCQANGTDAVYEILLQEKYPAWKLIEFQKEERTEFLAKRKKYLLPYPD